MKKKQYQKPTMQVVQLQQQTHLLQASASGEVNATMNTEWEDVDI